MKNPKNFNIKINGLRWEVKFLTAEEIGDFNGLCYHSELRIEIRKELPKPIARLRYIHELVHAIMGCQGRIFQKKYTDEEVCESMAYGYDQLKAAVDAFDAAEANCD